MCKCKNEGKTSTYLFSFSFPHRGTLPTHGRIRLTGQKPQPKWEISSHSVKGNSPTAARPEPMHKHFTQLFLWWDLMTWYLRHLLRIKPPLYTAQPASHCWLLKPQLCTASQVLLTAEQSNKPACFKLLSVMLSVTVSGIPLQIPKTCNIHHISLYFPKSYFWEKRKNKSMVMAGHHDLQPVFARESWSVPTETCPAPLPPIPSSPHTHTFTHFLIYCHSSASFRCWFFHGNTIQIHSNSLSVFFFLILTIALFSQVILKISSVMWSPVLRSPVLNQGTYALKPVSFSINGCSEHKGWQGSSRWFFGLPTLVLIWEGKPCHSPIAPLLAEMAVVTCAHSEIKHTENLYSEVMLFEALRR